MLFTRNEDPSRRKSKVAREANDFFIHKLKNKNQSSSRRRRFVNTKMNECCCCQSFLHFSRFFNPYPLSPCNSGVDAVMLLWFAVMLMATDFEDPTLLLLACILLNDELCATVLLLGGCPVVTEVLLAAAAAVAISAAGVFSPRSQ